MAFSPFNIFRRHQKVLLAGITLLAMFTFIVMGFKGDVTERFANWFGGKGKGTPVATLYGKKVTTGDLQEVRNQRYLANAFMLGATRTLADSIGGDTVKALDKFDGFNQSRVREALFDNRLQDPRLSQEERWQAMDADMQTLRLVRADLQGRNKTDQAQLVSDLLWAMELRDWALHSSPGDLYFGGTNSPDGQLDFLMWKHQADRLGIVLTDADVRNEVNRDLLNRDPLDGNEKKDAEKFGKYLGTQAGKVTVKDMYNALRNEYRVALAQAALTGAVPGVRGYRRLDTDTNQVPAVVTPADFWNYYKDNRTTLKVDLLPVPVSGFLDQAPTPGKENEKELQTLYRRYKGSEPLPDSETPGFKVPRRVRIAWVGGTRDAALYRKEAAEILRVSDALSRLGAGANGLASGGGPANWAVRLALPAAGDLRTSAEYATYLTRQPSWLEAPQALLQQHRLHDTSACAPAAVAAAVGQLLGAAATGGPAAAVPVSAEGSALNVETRERVRILGTSMMACASPSPLTALALTAPVVPRPLPLSAVRGQLDEQAVNALAAEFLVNNADKLRKDLEAAGRKPDQLLKVAREKAPAYGLSVHVMGEESDPYHLADAPALREFRSWYRQRPPVDDPRGNRFAALFLQKDGVGVVQSFPPQQRLEQVQKLMQDPNLKFLLAQLMPLPDYVAMWWKVEDKEAYVPSFEEARPKVVEAWRAQKARELAQAEADKLAAAARKAGIDADKFLRDEAARHPAWGDVRELDNVARLVTPRKALIGPTEYFPYQPDPSLKLRPDFVDDLMRHLKEKGDTTVVANGPKDVFYVVLLRDRAEPSEKQFYTAYSETPLRDTLWVRFERRQRERYRQQAVEQLRREASPDGVENGKWKLPPELRKDAEGGGRWDGE